MTERKIGEIFVENGVTVKCVKSDCGCLPCFYHIENRENKCKELCLSGERKDRETVVFIKHEEHHADR